MQGRTFVNSNPIELRARLNAHKKHLEKLQEIQQQKNYKSQRLIRTKRPVSYQQMLRMGSIINENCSLLTRISEITQRKNQETPSYKPQMKTLNLQKRKEEQQQIAQRNQILAQALNKLGPNLRRAEWDQNFVKAQQYRKLISKEIAIQREKRYLSQYSLPKKIRSNALFFNRSKSVNKGGRKQDYIAIQSNKNQANVDSKESTWPVETQDLKGKKELELESFDSDYSDDNDFETINSEKSECSVISEDI